MTLLIIVLVSTLAGYYWALTRYFAVASEGAMLILAPVALLAGLIAVYSYYLGWVRHRRGTLNDPQWRVFERRFRIFVFGLILILPSALALFSLLARQDLAVTVLFALIAAAIAPWVIRKVRAEARAPRS